MPLLSREPPRLRLTEDLDRVRAEAGGGAVPLSALLGSGSDRGFALVLLVTTLPFVLPFPTLGLATPVGFALALAAAGIACGRRAVLPRALGAIEIGPAAMDRAHAVLARAAGVFARVTRPRLSFLVAGRGFRTALGLSLFVAALVLGLPIPLPLSNFFPAVAILLMAAGVLEGDGLLVLAGHLATLAVCGVVAATSTVAFGAAARVLRLF